MNREEIIQRMSELQPAVDEYNKLNEQLRPLQDAWEKENLTFEQQVVEYFRNIDGRGKVSDWLPNKETTPLLYAYIHDRDVSRHQRILYANLFDEEIYYLTEPEEIDPKYQTYVETLYPIFKEIMDNKLAGCTVDW